MPSTSKKQHNFMAAVANNPAFAKKAGVPQSVGKDFTAADKGLKIPKAGSRPDLQKVNSPKTNQGTNELFKKGGSTMATKASNLFKGKETMAEELKEAKAIKSGKISPMQYAKGEKSEGVHKMANGGMTALAKHAAKPASKAHAGLKAGGSTSSFRASANGIAQRGKTKAMMPKMAGSSTGMKKGGKC